MLKTALLALVISLIMYSATRAQTTAEAHACCPDAVRFCGVPAVTCRQPVLNATVGQMLVCGAKLLWHRAELSPACRAAFAAHGK